MNHSTEDNSKPERNQLFEKKLKSLPKGYRITSVDRRIAQDNHLLFGGILTWDDKSKTWKRAVTGMEIRGPESADHLFVNGAGRDGLGVHYYWDKRKQLWVDAPNPPKPPPEGATISSDVPGYAGTFTAEGYVRYQWDEEEQRWIRVDDVPLGFWERAGRNERLEAVSHDDDRVTIVWDRKRKAWFDAKTGDAPKARPQPPPPAVVKDSDPDMAVIKDKNRYFLWNKGKQRWVMLPDPPGGFSRGANPREAHEKEGSALDRWIVWDPNKEAWVDFGRERRLNISGRIR